MSTLTGCMKKAGTALRAEDKAAILAAVRDLKRSGVPAQEAAAQAVGAQLAAVRALIDRIASGAQAPTPEPTAKERALADMNDALGDLADIFGAKFKANMLPEQEQKLLPVLTRVMDAAFRAGYYSFKEAARFVLDTIRAKLGNNIADAITLDYLQGSYIGMSGKYKDQGATSKRDVVSIDTLAELDAAPAPAPVQAPAPAPAPIPAPAPAPEPVAPAPAAPKIVEHVTAKGKTLRGVVRTDLSFDEAKAIDRFTFKKDGGLFIREEHLDALNAAQPAAAPKAEPAPKPQAPVPADVTLGDTFDEAIRTGNMPKDNPALHKMVEKFEGAPATPERMKVAQETLETAIVRAARTIVAAKEGQKTTFDTLVRLYESQPLLNVRTSTSIENQAYSTPAPLAFVASELAGITNKTSTFEPTGGNGMLVIAASPGLTSINEINPDRFSSLQSQGLKPTQKDATQGFPSIAGSFDRVIMNPPFGPIKDAAGDSIKVKYDGYTFGQIDHLIAAHALATMKDDGRATLIIGANKAAGLQSNQDLIFFNWLYSHYRVTSHFEADGDLYLRQGAGWPVRIITIHGRFKSDAHAPSPGTIQRASTWGEVYERFDQGMASGRAAGVAAASSVGTRPGPANEPRPVPGTADGQTRPADPVRPEGGASGAGNVAGGSPRVVGDRGAVPAAGVGERTGAKRPDAAPTVGADVAGNAREPGAAKPAGNPRTAGVAADPGNQFQTAYVARSSRKDEGVLIPVNMAGPTQDALNRLEDEVGDIDEFVKAELGYKSTDDLHAAFMGLQVDSVASAIHQMKSGKGVIIADQTGIGKGRQAAGIIRWAVKNGQVPVFVTVKPSLFTDMFGDLHDIGTDDVAPFILNSGEAIKGVGDERLFGNQASTHKRTLEDIASSGELPSGRNALFMTYSQINVANTQRQAVMALATNAVFVLDESHNAGGDSSTGAFIKDVLELGYGVTYLSATYAKRPDNMPVYFKTDIGDAVADDTTLMAAMEAGGLPLQTVVSNNLVKAGQMFRRERSYDGVNIESRADTEHRVEHVKLSNETTLALRAIVKADRIFHEFFVKAMQKELEKEGARLLDMAGNQAQASVDHTQFSSVVHNFVRQMLLGLKAQEAANEAIRSLKRGEKPLIAVENTMGSFLSEYADNNGVKVGDPLGAFDYRTVLSRALERSRYIVRQLPNGDRVKEYIPMGKLDPQSYVAYTDAQSVIDKLKINIPVSPIDWMRNEITKAGYTVAEVTGRNLSVDYTEEGSPKLDQLDAREQKDKVRTTRLFNAGNLDALILNVAGSTGISLHASEKFADQRQRHMIVAQAAQDINIFMQMLGRVHRTGQVALPKYTILSADLPAEIRPTALLSGKMKSLNANTSSNTESATSVKAADMLNKYGDQVVGQFLSDNTDLADALHIDPPSDSGEGADDIARRATGRLALMPVKVQEQFYSEVEEQYQTLIEYLNKTNQNDLEPRTFDFDAQEVKSATLFEGQNKASPFGEDAIYGEYSVKAQGKAMTPVEIRELMAEHLAGKESQQHIGEALVRLGATFDAYVKDLSGAEQLTAGVVRSVATDFMRQHPIGATFRVDINGDAFNAVVTNIRNTHKTGGNPFAMSKFQVTVALNGALRSVTVPATQFTKIETSRISGYDAQIERLFKVRPTNERETAKIVTGNLLGAYGELDGTRGSIITFTKQDGSTEQGILLPKSFNFAKDTRQDYRLKSPADVVKFLTNSQNENIDRFGINSRDSMVRVRPGRDGGVTIQVPKSKAKGGKYFLDKKLLAHTGDFVSAGSYMLANAKGGEAIKALEVLMQKGALYALPSMTAEAREILNDPAPSGDAMFSRKPAAAPTDATPAAAAPQPINATPNARTEAVEHLVRQIAGRWKNAPEIIVVSSINDPTVPEKVRLDSKGQSSKDAQGTPEGVFYQSKVYLFADQLPGDMDVLRVLMHETLGHFGLRGTFGQELGTILDRIAVLNAGKVRDKARQYGLNFELQKERRQAAEEVLAEMAQNTPELGWVQKAIAAIRTWMRENIPGAARMKFSDAELLRLFLIPARNFVKAGQVPGGRSAESASTQPAMHEDAATFSRESGKWFDESTPKQQRAMGGMPRIDTYGSFEFRPVSGLHDTAQANFTDYETAPGVRSVRISALDVLGGYDTREESARIASLSEQIKSNGEIEPVIVGVEPNGMTWLIEGQHRVRALQAMGRKTVPARVVLSGEGTAAEYEEAARPPRPYRAPAPTDYKSDTQQTALFSRSIGGAVSTAANTVADKFNKGPQMVGRTGRAYSAEQMEAMKNVGFEVEPPTIQERAQAIWKDAGKKLAQGLVDQFAPVKDIDATAYGLLRLSKGAAGAFEVMLRGGKLRLQDGVYDFDESQRGGVVDKLLIPLQGEHHDLLRWIAANRAERLKANGKENLFSEGDIAALKSLSQGVTTFDYTLQNGANAGTVTRDRTLIYADALRTFNDFSANVLDMAEQSGLIDGEARKLWENEFYVPFYRVEDDGTVGGADIKNGAVRQQAFKSLTGRTNKLNADLLDNTLMNWAHLLDASAKNRAAKASIEAAEKMGAADAVDGQMGKGTVWFREAGERRYSFVNDPHLLTAISALEYTGRRSPVMNAMGTFKRMLTIGVTSSPFFKIRNLIRDSVQVIGTSPISYNPAKNIVDGWKLTDPKSDAYFRLLAGGGTIHFGTMFEGSEAKRVQQLVEAGVDESTILDSDQKVKAFYRKVIQPAVHAYTALGDRGEAINRATLYDQLVKQGVSHADASLQARDLMDFSMQGSFASVRFLTQVVPFFNARIQGLYKLGRAAKEDPKRFSAVIGAAAVMSLMLLLAGKDDDDWKKREDWDRNNYWWFKFGGTAFRIPKPFEIGAIATLAERGFELAFDKEMTGKRFRSQVLALLGDNLAMNPIPQMVKPMLDVYANKDSFTGRPIETMGMDKLKPEYRFAARTSMAARGMSTAANAVTGLVGADTLSPVQIDHLLRGYFGWLGSFVVSAGDILARPATGQASQPAPDYWKAATGNMVSDLRDAPSRYVSQMYTQAKEVEEAYGTWRALLKDGKREEAAQFRSDNATELVKYHNLENVKRTVARINGQIRALQSSDRPADEKREALRSLQDRKDRIARTIATVE